MAENAGAGFTEYNMFRCPAAYVYQIPPGTAAGHSAQLWDVDHWLKEVAVRVVTKGDACSVKLEDQESGELFAEAPLPDDPWKVHTSVEPVNDSSRYFALKVVDTTTGSGQHAFIGIGFRERAQASDFNAALDEHKQFLKRRVEAAKLKEEREAKQASGSAAPEKDYSLKEGQTIHIKVAKKGESKLKKTSNVFAGGAKGGGLLAPPPPGGKAKGGLLAPPPTKATPPKAEAAPPPEPAAEAPSSPKFEAEFGDWAPFPESASAPASAGGVPAPAAGSAAGFDDDAEWGDFTS